MSDRQGPGQDLAWLPWMALVARNRFAALPPVRAWRAANARRAFAEARSILFVCKGNICRSPFAEAYARAALGDGVEVASAGYDMKAGRPCPPDGLIAARELGVALESHRSQGLTDELVRRADVIFVFDRANYDAFVARFGDARDKVHRLGYLLRTGVPDIRDPYERGVDEFRFAYGRIATTLDASARR